LKREQQKIREDKINRTIYIYIYIYIYAFSSASVTRKNTHGGGLVEL